MPHDVHAPHPHRHPEQDRRHPDRHRGHDHAQDHRHEHHEGHGHHDHQGHHHGHGHGDGSHSERRLRIAFGLTAAFMLAELVGGWWANSLALIADAGHMFTDAAALALALAAMHLSRRPVDPQRSYGYGRMQVLAAFTNGLALLAIAVWIIAEAASRLLRPETVDPLPMLVIASLGLVVNLGAFWALHGGDRHNLNLRGALAHVVGDLLGSAAAVLAAITILVTGWHAADPLLSLLVALLILRSALRLTRDSAHILLQGTPLEIDLAQLESQLRHAVPGLAGIHHVHLWSLTPGQRIMTLHAVLSPGADGDQVTHAVVDYLKEARGIGHVTVQVEQQPCRHPVHQ